ncbi:MAG: immune inhibitor A [candidate division WOR-3 bacterium]|nr:immune inhibitor A [candidate division WOR-3 bacterium]MCX7757275.1 immune inhibitor A [candidate division WOR-3 bacterium]MDW7987996.1 immune inhibitor A [candidate division WOR-3 bacterium]
MNNKIKLIIFLITLYTFGILSAEKIVIKKIPNPPNNQHNERIKNFLVRQIRIKENKNPHYKNLLTRIRKAAKTRSVDTIKVLALRVEFQEDNTPLTTGNGKMDLAGFLTPNDGLLYDPPHTRRYFERHLEGLRNYYWLNSMGTLYIDFCVMPNSVLGAYQLPHPMMYYGDTMWQHPYYEYEGAETGLCRLLYDAIQIADRDPDIRFSDYDLLIIFHAGSAPQSDMNPLRPNSPFDLLAGTIPSSALERYLGTPYILADEGQTRIYSAMIMPEMMRQDTLIGGQMNILGMMGYQGTLYHEFVHLLGGYDLYDISGATIGVGSWSLMGTGAWLGEYSLGIPPGAIPSMLDAFHRVYFGWVTPLVINTSQDSIPIYAASMDTTKFSLYTNNAQRPLIIKVPITETEYFLIENRQTDVRKKDTVVVDLEDGVLIWVEDGEYDFLQPGSGILIWHVDGDIVSQYGIYNAINVSQIPHKGVDLEEGDGIQDYDFDVLYNRTYQYYGSPYDPFFVGGVNQEFSAYTTPSSDGYTGKSFIKIKVLSPPDTVMYLNIDFELAQPGFPINPGRNIKLLSCHTADLNFDGQKEIITADSAGRIYVFNNDGTSYLQGMQGNFAQLSGPISGSPAIGDVCGDEKLEVICATENGLVYIYSDQGVIPIYTLNTQTRILAPPTLADIDSDGKKEIILGTTNMMLYVWKGDGSNFPGFPILLNSEIRSPVAITDTVNPQIVVLGSDQKLFLINPQDAIINNKFPLSLSHSALYNSIPPVVADFDNDGNKEIAVVIHQERNSQLIVVTLTGDIKYYSAPIINRPVSPGIAVADLNKDGFLDIVIAGANKIYVFNFNGTLLTNYPITIDSIYLKTELVGDYLITIETPFVFTSTPAIADLNNDYYYDIVIGSPQYGVLGFNGITQLYLSYFPLLSAGSISATPLIDNIDNDDDLEIIVGSDKGILYGWNIPTHTESIAWGQYLNGPTHCNIYKLPIGASQTSEIAVKNFYIYPNPADKEIVVRYWLGKDITDVKLSILDILGNPIYTFKGKAIKMIDNETRVQLDGINTGIYILRLEAIGNNKREIKFYKFAVIK